jgi:hypothetical protein
MLASYGFRGRLIKTGLIGTSGNNFENSFCLKGVTLRSVIVIKFTLVTFVAKMAGEPATADVTP